MAFLLIVFYFQAREAPRTPNEGANGLEKGRNSKNGNTFNNNKYRSRSARYEDPMVLQLRKEEVRTMIVIQSVS